MNTLHIRKQADQSSATIFIAALASDVHCTLRVYKIYSRQITNATGDSCAQYKLNYPPYPVFWNKQCNIFFTGRICRRQLCRYCFYSWANFLVFRPAGATRCTDQGEIWHGGADLRSAPPCQISPWSVQGWGFTAPKTGKNSNFTNIIAPKGRVSCTIFTNFTSFMRVLSLHNFAKFGCFILINDEIINNLLRLGRFQPNYRHPLVAKLWMGAKNV